MKKSFCHTFLIVTSLLFFTPLSHGAEVYFLRGGFDVFSLGLNDMAAQLQSRKINAKATSYLAWKSIASDITRRASQKKVSYPIILVGHSFGADAVTDLANYLGNHGVPTELVIGLDPTHKRVFTQGAKRVVNYRCSNADSYVKGTGFKGTITQINVGKNGVNHFNLDKAQETQAMVMREILAKTGKWRR